MTSYGTNLNQDAEGIRTSSEYGDSGDGTIEWFEVMRIRDGGDATMGAKADAPVTNPASSASAIAILKGLQTTLALINTASVAATGLLTAIEVATEAIPATNASTTALAASLVVKASAGRLRGLSGYSTTAQFLQIHNTATLPADGQVPVVVIPIEANKPFSIDFGKDGRSFSTGITVCVSTTGPTKTIGSANTWIDAQYI